jgi:hypothetical protein
MSLNRINQLVFVLETQRLLYSKNWIFKNGLDYFQDSVGYCVQIWYCGYRQSCRTNLILVL